MNYWLLVLPFISALIGWFIAGISLRFLFRPATPKKFFGKTILGVIPSRRQKITAAISSFASGFISTKTITAGIAEPGGLSKVLPVIEDHMDDFLRNRLKTEMPMIGMLIGDKTIATLKATFLSEIEKMLPQVLDKFAGNLTEGNKVGLMIAEKLNSIPPEEIERAIVPRLAPVWRSVKWTGALIGLICGLVQLLIIYLLVG